MISHRVQSGSGSQPALDPAQWVDRYGDALYRYALSRLRDRSSAEDAVQETFVSALEAKDQYTGSGSEAAWLMGILKREIVDHVRRRSRRAQTAVEAGEGRDLAELLFDEEGRWAFEGQPGAALEREELWRAFQECLSTLPPRQADVFTLREMEEMAGRDICQQLRISASNLWVLLYRARLQLSNCLKARGQTEEVR